METGGFFRQWEPNFVVQNEPSIEFLELFALLAGILTWDEYLTETRVILFCDNMSVVHMVNNSSSKCGQYMKLIRLLTLNNLKFNRRIFVRHIEGKNNVLSDALSRLDLKRFFSLAPKTTQPYPDTISQQIWPVSKI